MPNSTLSPKMDSPISRSLRRDKKWILFGIDNYINFKILVTWQQNQIIP
ncbi:hypothetical protein HMPREF9140_01090 [Prevotella micans F0438]|uniref:Uncharacterized protein n=1 Tax=Prevotella micans F0438 TaxID=883158 RepID=H1Q2F2_9BACT|nr:hypothetical protein HMPREF9140_01090 [Prevotella micans F0438]